MEVDVITREYVEVLDRYTYIADYFVKNPDRITKNNINYLDNLSESLRKDLFKVSPIFEGVIKTIRKKLEDILSGNELEKLKIEFLNRPWGDGIY
jgi:hypothetical protein